MLSKEEVIELWCKYPKESDAPEQYRHMFTVNGFKRLVEGTFLTNEEQDKVAEYTHCIYKSQTLAEEYLKTFVWDETHWMELLKYFLVKRLRWQKSNVDLVDTIQGIAELLGVNMKDIKHVEPEKYKQLYNGTEYGYFGMPLMVDIANHFGIDIDEYVGKIRGFVPESTVQKFDMNQWQNVFKDSHQITMLKDSVTDGRILDEKEFDRYEWGSFEHFKIEKKFYPSAEYMWMIHQVAGKYIPLRRINDGAIYVERLLKDYGWLMGFYEYTPIYKINTVQGFSFYICGGAWDGGAYIDDVNIKKIYYGSRKPVNNGISTEKRIFVIYNESTGYWSLPELYYPEVYKNFVKDTIKKHKEIGKWNETHVFASSRTLNSFKQLYDRDDNMFVNKDLYPDVKTKEEFIDKIADSAVKTALNTLHLSNELSSLGLKAKVEYENAFDFDKIVKPIALTQEEVNAYCGITKENTNTYEITNY